MDGYCDTEGVGASVPAALMAAIEPETVTVVGTEEDVNEDKQGEPACVTRPSEGTRNTFDGVPVGCLVDVAS
jgi:hypothetical protein